HVRLPGTAGSDEHGSELAGHIADAMLYWLNQPAQVAKTARTVDVALIGAGNIRAPLQSGQVFEGHIRLEVLPFTTPLSVLTVSGRTIQRLLTETISATLQPGAHAGKFPYAGNLRYSVEAEADGKLHFSQLQVLKQGAWLDLDPKQQYVLATTQYLADGNDGWHALQLAQQQQTDRVDVVLTAGQAEVFAVQQVLAQQDAQGATSFSALYETVSGLPCKDANVDCKVAAQAVIDYLQAKPQLFQQPRPATVTLKR
ncbi:MAG TPA: 5'-nucleotidase, partial [Rheinheimera sp.]|nr:5'-nucleotidase [Rheinheimera sp.]